ncbi:MAG: DUF4982 domain-containing protein [Clostridia bacterium]|nr:DUF4982 domain-containing protein [Clostridia bacterium]
MATANYDLTLREGWQFHRGSASLDDRRPNLYTSTKAGYRLGHIEWFLEKNDWTEVELPHDWLAGVMVSPDEDSSCGYKPHEEGWYHLHLTLPDEPVESAELIFDGVMGKSTVYVNGILAGRNFSGYNRFAFQVGDFLKPGKENLIVVHADARHWEGWWYEGAGIYRPVTLRVRQYSRFVREKCFLRGEFADGTWHAAADLGIDEPDGLQVSVVLTDADGLTVAEAACTADETLSLRLPIANPALWSPDAPYLYRMTCTLTRDGAVIDTVSANIGLRTIQWSANDRMRINGVPTVVKGICCHQDHGGVGVAVTPEVMEYRIRLLKKQGINAYRCAHHAPAPELLEICDRLGMLVLAENRHFDLTAETLSQIDDLVTLCRNHPSVFLYSIFNEEPLQSTVRGRRMAKKLREHIRRLDTTRPVTAAMSAGVLTESNVSDEMDVVGINYCLKEYPEAHARLPEKPILGTENCPTFATRGVCRTDEQAQVFAGYGDEWARFAESMAETLSNVEENVWISGSFPWSGFDYFGEPAPHPWPSVSSHWGIMDMCGFEKDTAGYLRAWYKSELTAHLLPHWNHEAGEEVRVCVFTNGERAELRLNGRVIGESAVEKRRAEWKVAFEPGVLQVRVTRGGEIVTDEVRTAGDAVQLVTEDATPSSDGRQRILNLAVTDESGTIVPWYDGRVMVKVEEGRVYGVSNGDPRSHEVGFHGSVKLFSGRAQIITSQDARLSLSCGKLIVKMQ